MNELITKRESRNNVMAIEKKMREHPSILLGDSFPLRHSFADGMYVRELSVPANVLFVTKIHKKTHPMFLLKGTVAIYVDGEVKKVIAPYSFITPSGTKRVVYTYTDIIWTTVHKTNKRNLKKIEDEIIAKDFSEIPDEKERIKLLRFEESAINLNKGESSCLL